MPSTLLIHPTGVGATQVTGAITDHVAATGGSRLPLRLDGLTRAGHWTATSLPSRLNQEWAGLCDSADNDLAVKDWAAPGQGRPGLTQLIGADGLHSTVQLLQGTSVTVSGRDAVLVGLLERAQDGDRLAGRVVLQTVAVQPPVRQDRCPHRPECGARWSWTPLVVDHRHGVHPAPRCSNTTKRCQLLPPPSPLASS